MFIAVDVSSKDNIEKLQHKLRPTYQKYNLNQLKLPIPVLAVFQIQILLE
jgi:membrane protein insertase Oxa1/YidC/SpoIIIJ